MRWALVTLPIGLLLGAMPRTPFGGSPAPSAASASGGFDFVDAGIILANTEFRSAGLSTFNGTASSGLASGAVSVGNVPGATTAGAVWFDQATPSGTNYALRGDTSGNTFLGSASQIQFAIGGTGRGGLGATGKWNIGPLGDNITQMNSGTATLDFASSAAGACSADLTITVTGALTTSTVHLGVPNGSVAAGSMFFAWASAADTVKVRHCCINGTCDPASGTFRAWTINP